MEWKARDYVGTASLGEGTCSNFHQKSFSLIEKRSLFPLLHFALNLDRRSGLAGFFFRSSLKNEGFFSRRLGLGTRSWNSLPSGTLFLFSTKFPRNKNGISDSGLLLYLCVSSGLFASWPFSPLIEVLSWAKKASLRVKDPWEASSSLSSEQDSLFCP